MRAPLAALLLLALALAGCTDGPQVEVRARSGDFVRLALRATDEAGRVVLEVTDQRAVIAEAVPPRLPPGWDANLTLALPSAVREALDGQVAGGRFATGSVPPERGFGPWDTNRTIQAPQRHRVPRVQDLPAPLELEGNRLRWAGAAWNYTLLAEEVGTARVRLEDSPQGAELLFPDYWNDRYQLWSSRVVEADEEALVVEHLAEPGRQVSVGGQPYRIVVEDGTVVADGNPPLARATLTFEGELHEVVFPEPGGPPRAPDILLVEHPGGRVFNLSALRGKPVLLDFFASWCVTCKQQAPVLARAREHYGDNLTVLSVTIDPTDTPDRVAAFRAEVPRTAQATLGRALEADWTFAFDPTGAGAKGFSVAGIPREVLLDDQGRIRATSVGVHPWPDLKEDLDALLAASAASAP